MKKKKNGMAYAYLAPTLITILLVTCLPILYTVILSFTNYNMYHWEITLLWERQLSDSFFREY